MTSEQLKQIYFSFYEIHELCDRMKYLYNCNDIYKGSIVPLDLSQAILRGFNWIRTSEGYSYWLKIYRSI